MKGLHLMAIAAMAGSNFAPGQSGFIMHFDAVQAGRSGRAVSVREVPLGYLVFASQFSQQFPTKQHIYTRRIDPLGAFEQEHEYLVGLDRGFDIGYIDAVASNSDGTFTAVIDEGRDFASRKMLYRFNAEGDTLERRFLMTYPPEDSISQAIRQIRALQDGYAFCGFHDLPQQSTKAMLGRLSATGDTLWLKQYGTESEAPVALGVVEYSDGGFLLTGYGTPPGSVNKSFLIRTDANGNQIWRRNYGGRATAVNGAVRVGTDGGIITWSAFKEEDWPTDWQQMMLTQWNGSGGITWERKSHYNYFTTTFDVEILPDGAFIATGTALLEAVLAKFSSTGDSLWSRSYTPTHGGSYLYDVQPTSDGGFIATGETFRYDPIDTEFQTNQIIWVLKTDSLGCVVPGCQNVGVGEYALDMNEYLQVWPNPVGDLVNFSFTPPTQLTPNGPLRVTVLDATGRQVQAEMLTGASGQLTMGNWSAGAYHLHLSDGHRWLAGRTIVKE